MLIIMASNVGFKLSTFERFNLSLPSFMTVRFLHPLYQLSAISKLRNFFFNDLTDFKSIVLDRTSDLENDLKK